MFYVNSKKGNKYGVIDTNDGVIEYYTAKELINIISSYSIKIEGCNLVENKISIKVTDFDIVKKNLITLRDLLIKVKDLNKFKSEGYDIGEDDDCTNLEIFICDMGYHCSDYIFLEYSPNLDKYYFYDGTDSGISLKEDFKEQMIKLGLMDLKFDIYMTYSEMIDYIKSLRITNKRVKILSNVELSKLYQIVDRPKGWHFPDAKLSYNKAVSLLKEGYSLVINGKETDLSDFKSIIKNDLRVSGMTAGVRFYSYVSEYIDTKNKVFYVKLGSIDYENLM